MMSIETNFKLKTVEDDWTKMNDISLLKAWVSNIHWNGFIVPFFELEEAKRMVFDPSKTLLTWFEDLDCFLSFSPENNIIPSAGQLRYVAEQLSERIRIDPSDYFIEDPACSYTLWSSQTIETEDGPRKVWCIGGFHWTWMLEDE